MYCIHFPLKTLCESPLLPLFNPRKHMKHMTYETVVQKLTFFHGTVYWRHNLKIVFRLLWLIMRIWSSNLRWKNILVLFRGLKMCKNYQFHTVADVYCGAKHKMQCNIMKTERWTKKKTFLRFPNGSYLILTFQHDLKKKKWYMDNHVNLWSSW